MSTRPRPGKAMINMTRTITAASIQASDLRVRGGPGPVGVGA
jgi:hypothetical protein